MADLLQVHILSTALLGIVFGGMLFFAGFVAPMVFIKLRAETAAQFMREIFPFYYVGLALMSGASTWLLTQHRLPQDAFAMGAVALGFVFAAMGLLPRMNTLRERASKGDPAANSQFKWLHRLSVALNTMQLILTGALFLRAIAS